MINLLPLKEKTELLREETKKLIVIIGVVILISLISLILILFSVKSYIWGQAEAAKIILAGAQKEFKSSEFQDLQEKITLTNLSFSKLKSFYQQQSYFIETLERISNILPKTIYLYNLSLTKAQVSLSGFAPNRETLFEFKRTLEAQPCFQEVYFPPSSWIKPENIDFFVSFKIE